MSLKFLAYFRRNFFTTEITWRWLSSQQCSVNVLLVSWNQNWNKITLSSPAPCFTLFGYISDNQVRVSQVWADLSLHRSEDSASFKDYATARIQWLHMIQCELTVVAMHLFYTECWNMIWQPNHSFCGGWIPRPFWCLYVDHANLQVLSSEQTFLTKSCDQNQTT